jgi:hypothetical protein
MFALCFTFLLPIRYIQQSFYDFRYDDEDTVMNEIDEFYSYVEMPQVEENLKAWKGSFPGGMQYC